MGTRARVSQSAGGGVDARLYETVRATSKALGDLVAQVAELSALIRLHAQAAGELERRIGSVEDTLRGGDERKANVHDQRANGLQMVGVGGMMSLATSVVLWILTHIPWR